MVGEDSVNQFNIEKHVPSTHVPRIDRGTKHSRSLKKNPTVSALSFELKPKWWRVFIPASGLIFFMINPPG
jgi:hypothetical protein